MLSTKWRLWHFIAWSALWILLGEGFAERSTAGVSRAGPAAATITGQTAMAPRLPENQESDVESAYGVSLATCRDRSLDYLARSLGVKAEHRAVAMAISRRFPEVDREAALRGCRDGFAARANGGAKRRGGLDYRPPTEPVMTEEEAATVMAFLRPGIRKRVLRLGAQADHRGEYTSWLGDQTSYARRFVEPTADDVNEVLRRMSELGAGRSARLVSEHPDVDGVDLALDAAIRLAFDTADHASLVIVVPGELAYFHGREAGSHRWLLRVS